MDFPPSWSYRFIKPVIPGGKSAYFEAKALAREGLQVQEKEKLFAAGPSHRKQVALTFSDGPHPEITPAILDVLKAGGVHATFFLIGREALSNAGLARKIVDAGHEVGNHTMNHVMCSSESERELARQIQDAQDAIRFATNKEALWFRPPFGDLDEIQRHLPTQCGLKTVYWTHKIRDWENDDEASILRQMTKGLKPGAIFALHEKRPCVATALEKILVELKKRDLKPVTLSELFAREKPRARKNQ